MFVCFAAHLGLEFIGSKRIAEGWGIAVAECSLYKRNLHRHASAQSALARLCIICVDTPVPTQAELGIYGAR